MDDFNPLLRSPKPDFPALEAVLKGIKKADKIHHIELAIDIEIMEVISESFMNKKWLPKDVENPKIYYRQLVEMYHQLGYDALLEGVWREVWVNHPPLGSPKTGDTAGELSRGEREWAVEGIGIINSWEDFENFPWSKLSVDFTPYEIYNTILPDGMKIYASSSHFEHVLENLLGYEGLFFKIADEPELVKRVFDDWGELVLNYYENVVDFDCVGAIWHADDLGYKTGTMLSPEDLNKFVFPWMKKFAAVAHAHGKLFLLHSCGNYFDNGVIDDLIGLGVDVIHSFQDVILPADKAVKLYGSRVGFAGGVDVDGLCRMNQEQLKIYCRKFWKSALEAGLPTARGIQ